MSGTMQTIRTVDLGYEQMFIFDGGPQTRVRVLYGTTWLTEEGQPGDSVVGAGDEVPLHGGRALVEALRPARIEIVETPATLRRGGWLRQLARSARQLVERLQLGARAAAEPHG